MVIRNVFFEEDIKAKRDIYKVEAEHLTEEEYMEKLKKIEERATNQRITYRYDEIYPEDLKPHPINSTLYGKEEEADMEIVEKIRRKGLLEQIIITSDNVILSGYTQWLALLYINKNKLPRYISEDYDNWAPIFTKMKAKCQIIVFDVEDEKEKALEEKKAVIQYNKQLKKPYSQVYNEIELLHEIYDELALVKSLMNLKQNSERPISAHRLKEKLISKDMDPQLVDDTLTPEELGVEASSMFRSSFEIDNNTLKEVSQRTRDRISKELDMGRTNVDKLTEIGRLAKKGDEVALQAMKKLDEGEWKITGAHIIIKMRKYVLSKGKERWICDDLIKDALNKKKTPAAVKKEISAIIPDIFTKPHQNKNGRKYNINSKKYSIILVDLVNFKQIFDLESDIIPQDLANKTIPADETSALILIADLETIKYCFNLLKMWQFGIKWITTLEPTQKNNENCFLPRYDMLLFATKGNWLPPSGNLVSDNIIRKHEHIYQFIEEIYPNINSWYEVGVEEQREGWGIPVLQRSCQTSKESQVNLMPQERIHIVEFLKKAIGKVQDCARVERMEVYEFLDLLLLDENKYYDKNIIVNSNTLIDNFCTSNWNIRLPEHTFNRITELEKKYGVEMNELIFRLSSGYEEATRKPFYDNCRW